MGCVWKGTNSGNILSKMRSLKSCAKDWNKLVFGNIHDRISAKEIEQEQADMLNINKSIKHAIKENLEELYRVRSSMLCQQARLN